MLDFEGMLQRELDRTQRLARERDDELLFSTHFKTDQEFLRQCGIAWPQRREPCSP